jgi:DNA processing protein
MKRRPLTGGERTDWLRLARTRGVGPITFFQLLERHQGDAASVLDALPSLAKKAGGKSELRIPPRSEIDRELELADQVGSYFLAACEPSYSAALAAIDSPPPVLSLRGDHKLLGKPAVALVGARNASAAGRKMARDLARDLGQAGLIVISGMARGVDGEAHAASLETGTIAVLAGGIDQIYPPEHAELYNRLCQQGLVVSESPVGYTAQAKDFPRRNRVISGLSLACVVVEAAERSGSLITAKCALQQGREVMAVPGSPLDPRCAGANRLIKQGALLVETADDVIRAMEGMAAPSLEEPGNDAFTARGGQPDIPPSILTAVRQALSPTPMTIDEIVRAVDAPQGVVLAALVELELAGEAATHVGGLASRAV